MSDLTIADIYPHPFTGIELIEGYTEEEISKLEEMFQVTFTGDLRSFLKLMGKCPGSLFGSSNLTLFNPGTPEDLLVIHSETLEEISELPDHKKDITVSDKDGMFIFSNESDYLYYYFVLTRTEKPDAVYFYDEYNLCQTGETFQQHLKKLAVSNRESRKKYWPTRADWVVRRDLLVEGSRPEFLVKKDGAYTRVA